MITPIGKVLVDIAEQREELAALEVGIEETDATIAKLACELREYLDLRCALRTDAAQVKRQIARLEHELPDALRDSA